MALFDQYTKPGVYVRDTIEEAGIPLFGNARIAVFVGEGEEYRTFKGIAMHRGSSNSADELAVRENISDQITGMGRSYKLNYFPVVQGDGKGTIANEPKYLQLYANDIPIMVSQLKGTSGEFITQSILPLGTDLRASYYFKRMDTPIKREDLTSQVPTYASVSIQGGDITVSPSIPGALGDLISITSTMVKASRYIQNLKFEASVPGPVGEEISVRFVTGPVLGTSTLGAALTITVEANSTLADVLGLFATPVAVVLSTGNATISCTNPHGVPTNTAAVAMLAQSLEIVGPSDLLAVTGIGTDIISVELVKPDGTIRTKQEMVNLLNSGVFTQHGGTLTATLLGHGMDPAVAHTAQLMTQGFGPSTNTVFKVKNTPIVDGSNGGVVTTSPNSVTVTVNGLPVRVVSVDGLNGLITLASGVPAGATLLINYFTNNYQDTFDVLPGDNIVEIVNVGYGVGRMDFIDGIDYVLETDTHGAKIQWGASVNIKAGDYTAGYVPFDAVSITTTLVDEKVYMLPCQNAIDGLNSTFTLQDVPTDGSGLSRPTDDPAKIQVYVGIDPIDAYTRGAVRVTQLIGDIRTFSLYNPPPAGNKVYATSWRNNLNDKLWTLTVVNPGVTGQGTYKIQDENGSIAPVAGHGIHNVLEADFQTTGIVWPFTFPDLRGVAGATPDEVVTCTFQDDGLNFIVTPAIQATNLIAQAGLRFRTTNTGPGPNSHTGIILTNSGGPTVDALAVHKGLNSIGTTAFSGTGLDDAILDGTYTGSTSSNYVVQIDSTGTPDTFRWRKGTGVWTTGVVITGTAQPLAEGVQVTFLATTGHAANDSWTLPVVSDQEVLVVQIVNGSSTTRNLQDVINLFTSPTDLTQITTALAGRIVCEPSSGGVVLTTLATPNALTHFTGGDVELSYPYSVRYRVTSNRSAQQALADSLGRTGSATTPVTPNFGPNAVGDECYLGQTFIDLDTGAQFTLVDPNNALGYGFTSLPSPSYHFRPGDTLVFTFSSGLSRPTSSIPTIDCPGLRIRVTSTYGMQVGSTALVQTFNKAGAEPNIGDFYYLDYKTQKTAKDFGIKIFTNLQDAITEYGPANPTNKLSLAARLFCQNGGQVFGCVQTPKQVGLDTASDQTFMASIDSLAQPLPGSENKANIIIPLTTSQTVQQYLNRHLITQGSQRMCGEAIGYIGFDFYGTPNDARTMARALRSERLISVFPGGAILTLDIGGKMAEFAVTGEFIAAALAGMDMNPAYDVATSLTRKNIVGFDRLIKRYDDITMDLAASDGVCWLVERNGALQIRHYMTTDPSNPITREPTNRKVMDECHFRLRRNLDQFIARKILASLINDITVTAHATIKTMIDQELVEAYKDVVVQRDTFDPTVIHLSMKVKPVFSLLWLDVNLTVTTRI